ncbi:MAG: GTPase Era [Bacilli bacterium]|nr:GTPase Era [Bacilli bacterium]
MKCGYVSIIGRPNVGKSTLLNDLIGEKLAITSDVSGTTRNIINGIYNDEEAQIVFIDTPGVHKPHNQLEKIMNRKSYNNFDDVDVILFMIDAKSGFGRGDIFILERIKDKGIPIIALLNKIDLIKDKEKLLKTIDSVKDEYNFEEIIPISAGKNNLYDLVKSIKKYLPESEKIFSDDEMTNVSLKFMMAEYVREKILLLTHDEIPHTVSCYCEEYDDNGKSVDIKVLIVVERDNLKKIIIGKNGSMLKEIGIEARQDMEKFLNKKVYLETYVKTLKNWRDETKYLKELGLDLDENN